MPWLPVPPTYKTHNVARELKDPGSVLQFYRHLLALRHQNRALLDGEYIPLNENDPNVLSYLRRYKAETVLVVLNMSATARKARFDLSPQNLPSATARPLLTTRRDELRKASLGDLYRADIEVIHPRPAPGIRRCDCTTE
jgi:alpha-glucosidase